MPHHHKQNVHWEITCTLSIASDGWSRLLQNSHVMDRFALLNLVHEWCLCLPSGAAVASEDVDLRGLRSALTHQIASILQSGVSPIDEGSDGAGSAVQQAASLQNAELLKILINCATVPCREQIAEYAAGAIIAQWSGTDRDLQTHVDLLASCVDGAGSVLLPHPDALRAFGHTIAACHGVIDCTLCLRALASPEMTTASIASAVPAQADLAYPAVGDDSAPWWSSRAPAAAAAVDAERLHAVHAAHSNVLSWVDGPGGTVLTRVASTASSVGDSGVLIPASCGVFLCGSCVARAVRRCVRKRTGITAAGVACPSRHSDGEAHSLDYTLTLCVLPPDLRRDFEAACEAVMCTELGEAAKCPCGNMMIVETVSGPPDLRILPTRDDAGKPLTLAAMEHLHRFRVRCGSCEQSFCRACNTSPYHMGRDCAQHAALSAAGARVCRFCAEPLPPASPPNSACTTAECSQRAAAVCPLLLACGHACCGIRGEGGVDKPCLPCLIADCPSRERGGAASASSAGAVRSHAPAEMPGADDWCMICAVESLSAAPCLRLECGHVFHAHCVNEQLKARWNGSRITFRFMQCPLCHVDMQHYSLQPLLEPLRRLHSSLESKAALRASMEGLDKDADVANPGGRFHGKLKEYALAKLAYVLCENCGDPFFAGRVECNAALEEGVGRAAGADKRLCSSCVLPPPGVSACPHHGTTHLEYKCKWCCNPAVWFCHGHTHYCDPCHQVAGRNKPAVCAGPEACPTGGRHAPNGNEYAFACAECRGSTVAC